MARSIYNRGLEIYAHGKSLFLDICVRCTREAILKMFSFELALHCQTEETDESSLNLDENHWNFFKMLLDACSECQNKILTLMEYLNLKERIYNFFINFFTKISNDGLNNLLLPNNVFYKGIIETIRIFFRIFDFIKSNKFLIERSDFYNLEEKEMINNSLNQTSQIIKFTSPKYKKYNFTNWENDNIKKKIYFFTITIIAYSSVFIIAYYLLRVLFKGFKYLNLRRLSFLVMAILMISLKFADIFLLK